MTMRALVAQILIVCFAAVGAAACRGSVASKSEGSSGSVNAAGLADTSAEVPTGGPGPAPIGNGNIIGTSSVGFIGGNGNNYRLIGRFDLKDPNAVRASALGSKIGARFTGSSLSVMLSDTGTNRYNVSIDGVAQTTLVTSPSKVAQTYLVASNLSGPTHTVWMSKRTEPYQADKIDPSQVTGTTTFYGFKLAADGSFDTPPSGQSRLIEFLGDSGCTGYGVDQLIAAGASTCPYSIATQNADASVPAFTALAVDAEVVNMSASGRGIYTSEYDPNALTDQLPYLYKETVPPAAAPVYGFDEYVPNVVVINGGGDDIFGTPGNGNFPVPDAFLSAYTDLVTSIRGHYHNALIVCAVGSGTFGNDKQLLTGAISQVVSARTAAGDSNILFFDYFANSPNGWSNYGDAGATLGYGCEGHASSAGSKFLGGQLGNFIKTKMGW